MQTNEELAKAAKQFKYFIIKVGTNEIEGGFSTFKIARKQAEENALTIEGGVWQVCVAQEHVFAPVLPFVVNRPA